MFAFLIQKLESKLSAPSCTILLVCRQKPSVPEALSRCHWCHCTYSHLKHHHEEDPQTTAVQGQSNHTLCGREDKNITAGYYPIYIHLPLEVKDHQCPFKDLKNYLNLISVSNNRVCVCSVPHKEQLTWGRPVALLVMGTHSFPPAAHRHVFIRVKTRSRDI